MIEIRKATDEDVETLVRVFDEATVRKIEHGDNAWGDGKWSPEEVRELLAKDGTYVAEDDGDIAGTITVVDSNNSGMWTPDKAVYVEKLAGTKVHKGIGKTMLTWAEQYATEHGSPVLRLDCKAEVPELCDYYEKFGFKKVKTIPTEEDGLKALFEKQL